ncbi:hypothetical protein COO60DRAFT_1551038, partial [Scenedesmus sp. NREL 46B-D3]
AAAAVAAAVAAAAAVATHTPTPLHASAMATHHQLETPGCCCRQLWSAKLQQARHAEGASSQAKVLTEGAHRHNLPAWAPASKPGVADTCKRCDVLQRCTSESVYEAVCCVLKPWVAAAQANSPGHINVPGLQQLPAARVCRASQQQQQQQQRWQRLPACAAAAAHCVTMSGDQCCFCCRCSSCCCCCASNLVCYVNHVLLLQLLPTLGLDCFNCDQ